MFTEDFEELLSAFKAHQVRYSIGDLKPADLIDRGSFSVWGVPPHMVEILPQISGVTFDDAWQRRVEAVIDERTGLKACVISVDDLITNKVAAGRPRYLADVAEVRSAQRLRAET